MKRFIPLLILIFLFSSCKKALKNVDDYFPVLNLTADIQTDGTVLLKCSYDKNGEGPIETYGFSFSDTSDWYISQNQILFQSNEEFSHIYDISFDPTKTYYFRAFAVNKYGYSVSKVVSLTNIKAVPVIAPCTLTPNTFKLASSNINISNFEPAYNGFDNVDYTCSGANITARFVFANPPLTGIYIVKPYTSPGEDEVSVTISNGFNTDYLSTGTEVYVNRIDDNTFKVEICSSTWSASGTNFDFKCNFTRNY